MIHKDIQNREDVYKLVERFYDKVKIDSLLGPFFNPIIKNWDEHLIHLTTFWESSLFFGKKLDQKYTGDPLKVHVRVDQEQNNSITEFHFGVWLNLWYQTIDELFVGENAELAKRRARKMGTFLYLKIFEARQHKS